MIFCCFLPGTGYHFLWHWSSYKTVTDGWTQWYSFYDVLIIFHSYVVLTMWSYTGLQTVFTVIGWYVFAGGHAWAITPDVCIQPACGCKVTESRSLLSRLCGWSLSVVKHWLNDCEKTESATDRKYRWCHGYHLSLSVSVSC